MHFSTDVAVWLKIAGGISSGLGSLVFIWRAKAFFEEISNALLAHEHAIRILVGEHRQGTTPVLLGLGLRAAEFEASWALPCSLAAAPFLASGCC